MGDADDAFPLDPNEAFDNDHDGVGDNADADDDNDGVPDEEDTELDQIEAVDDFDQDGLDEEDPDDDNDGVPDEDDVYPFDPTEHANHDGDAVGDNADTDDDNDGYNDTVDAFPFDASEWADNDNDGQGDNADVDDDNDGVVDELDAFPYDASSSADIDNDGVADLLDVDVDGDGVPNQIDASLWTSPSGPTTTAMASETTWMLTTTTTGCWTSSMLILSTVGIVRIHPPVNRHGPVRKHQHDAVDSASRLFIRGKRCTRCEEDLGEIRKQRISRERGGETAVSRIFNRNLKDLLDPKWWIVIVGHTIFSALVPLFQSEVGSDYFTNATFGLLNTVVLVAIPVHHRACSGEDGGGDGGCSLRMAVDDDRHRSSERFRFQSGACASVPLQVLDQP